MTGRRQGHTGRRSFCTDLTYAFSILIVLISVVCMATYYGHIGNRKLIQENSLEIERMREGFYSVIRSLLRRVTTLEKDSITSADLDDRFESFRKELGRPTAIENKRQRGPPQVTTGDSVENSEIVCDGLGEKTGYWNWLDVPVFFKLVVTKDENNLARMSLKPEDPEQPQFNIPAAIEHVHLDWATGDVTCDWIKYLGTFSSQDRQVCFPAIEKFLQQSNTEVECVGHDGL